MINKIELWLNILHYCLYIASQKLHRVSNKLNPFVLLGRIPALKRKFEEQGTTHLDVINKVWGDKRYGFSIMISGGAITVILTFLLWALVTIIASLFDIYFIVKPLHLIAYGVSSYLICHYTVFYQDKYIGYFRMFDKWKKQEKSKYALVSFIFTTVSIALWH